MALPRHQLAAGLRKVGQHHCSLGASFCRCRPPPAACACRLGLFCPHRLTLNHRQDIANWCLTACVIIATAIVAGVAEPHQVPFVVWGGSQVIAAHKSTGKPLVHAQTHSR